MRKKCFARYEKPIKYDPLDVAKKYVERYSSSNAVAQNREERVQMNITHNRNSLNFKSLILTKEMKMSE